MTREEMLDHDPSLRQEMMEERHQRNARSWHPNDPDAPEGKPDVKADLMAAMAVAMNDVNDYSTTRQHFAEAAVAVLVNRGVVTFPESCDRVDLMDEITEAMEDTTDRPAWNEPWHPYANAILTVLISHGLMQPFEEV